MQRNLKLALELLDLIVSENEGGAGVYPRQVQSAFAKRYPDHEPGRYDVVEYHLHLLETAGFIVRIEDDQDEPSLKLTWAGHDYLEENSTSDFPGDFIVG